MLKFSLIVPNTRYNSAHLWSVLPSRGLLSLAACLKQNGFEVGYIDADFLNLSNDDVLSRIDTFGADVVGITMNTFQAKTGMDLAKTIRRKNADLRIVVGGPHPSALRGQLLEDCPEIDISCVGEGEDTIVDIAKELQADGDISIIKGISYRRNGALYDNPDQELIKDLDKIPFPAYELAGDLKCYPGAQPVLKIPSMHIMASRGCPYKCIFCTKSVWGNKVRFRKPEKIIDEVEFLHNKFGINEVFFQDDTMNVNRKWFFNVCDEIIARKLNSSMAFKTPFRVNNRLIDEELLEKAREAGFWMIFYGVESGNQKVLDTIKKGTTIAEIERAFELTHKAGIKTIAAFMVGNLGDTEETIQDSVELAKRIKPEVSGFSIATPLPGTEFYEIAKEHGWIQSDDFSEWSQFTAVSRNADLTAEEITNLRDFADKQVREYLAKKEGGFVMSWLSPQFKNKVKAMPLIGPLSLLLWRAIKRATSRESSTNLLSSDTDDIVADDIMMVDTEPYIDQQNRSAQLLAKDDLLYLEFENLFMRSEESRKTKAKYMEYVCRAYKLSNKATYFLDVGCGRGEFLELLDTAKIPAKGLEVNKIEYKALAKKGFNVHLENCNTFLEKIENNSLIGISAFQVIEHFDPDYLKNFIKRAYDKIAVNGVLILETVNPKCSFALSNFFLDFTHIRPYPPETIKFLVEWYGFKHIRLIYSLPCPKEFRIRNIKECNYYGYGVVAWKK